MRKTYDIYFCLDDIKNSRECVNLIFDIIAKAKAAIFSQSGVVKDFAYSNIPDREINIDGSIAKFSFDVATIQDFEFELELTHYAVDSGIVGQPPRIFPMLSFHRKEKVVNAIRDSSSVA